MTDYFSAQEVADRLMISIRSVRNYIKSGKLKSVKASWYGKAYRGNLCADGKTVFDERDPTIIAHRTLPFGSKCL